MGRTRVRETVTEFHPGRGLAYTLDGPAGPFATAASRWSLRRAGPGSTAVTVEGMFQPANAAARLVAWPLAKPMLQRLTNRVLRELETFVLASDRGSSRS
jgi:polyketide cyclase/dehydrase/lipid transport protein